MQIGFAGLGKLGLPVALAIEGRGHSVIAHDPADGPHEVLRTRTLASREAGASELLAGTRIELASMDEMVRRSEIIFVTIQTPHEARFEGVTRLPSETRDFDYRALVAGVSHLARAIEAVGEPRLVLIVSTVLPGTIRREVMPLLGHNARLAYNPFLIAMGTAISDFMNPEFVLLGVEDGRAGEWAEAFYRTIHAAPVHRTNIEDAEIIKLLYNTFISTKIAFANTAMELCHRIPGADVDVVLGVLRSAHERLISSRYFGAGMGDGGSCHPRDNIALSDLSRRLGLSYDWFHQVMEQRERQTEWLADLVEAHRRGRPVVLMGRSFKAGSDLVSGSPARLLEAILRERGLPVTAWDPHVDTDVPPPQRQPACYFIGTRHAEFQHWPYEPGSIVLDPWRFVSVPAGVELVPVGRGRPLAPPAG